MKSIFTLLVILAAGFLAPLSAQYYYIPNINAGTNPGGLNTDDEYPVGSGLSTTWTTVHSGSAASPVWTSTQTIPFSFNFNGNAFTQYKVATSGVLTFDLTAVSVPAYANASLPSASIPDNSICAWGVSGHNSGDYIVTKTFGSAPNRQHWIMFCSYSQPGTTCYVYWSIVLEETSNKIYIVDQREGGCVLSLTIGVQANSTTAWQVAGSPNVSQNAGSNFTPADNSYYEFIQGTQPAVETKLKSLNITQFTVVPGNIFIEGTVQNRGALPVSTFDITYEFQGVPYTSTINGINIASGITYNFIHSTPISVTVAGSNPVKVWVDVTGDADHSNDTLSTTVSGLTFMPEKRVLIEEATGTWCGWCPRGAVYTENIDQDYPGSAIVVAVHNGDPMVVAAYDQAMGALIGGYPSGLVDRKDIDIDPLAFETSYLSRINDVPPADVNVSAFFNSATRVADVVVSATFATEITSELRLGAIIVEDDVTGTGSGYNQVNYYSYQSQNQPLTGAGHNWQTDPNPVPAANMEYDFVGRALLGGFNGEPNSLPGPISANNTYSYTFTYTVPVGYDENSMRVIGVLIDPNSGNVLNVNRGAYGITTAVETIENDQFGISVYPNPAADQASIEINLKSKGTGMIQMFDMVGKSVYNREFNGQQGKNIAGLPVSKLNSGVYLVRFTMNGQSITQKLIVQ